MCPAAARFRSRSTRLSGLCMPANSKQQAGHTPCATAHMWRAAAGKLATAKLARSGVKGNCCLFTPLQCCELCISPETEIRQYAANATLSNPESDTLNSKKL